MSRGTFELVPPLVATNQQTEGRKVVISFADKPDFIPGRRSWVKYRELGVTEASGGEMRAQILMAEAEEQQTTGWHLHRCDMQFVYILKGALHMAFNPDHVFRLEAGDSVMIPGGTVHMEMGEAETVEVLEISLPADMGTENVDNPWGSTAINFKNYQREAV